MDLLHSLKMFIRLALLARELMLRTRWSGYTTPYGRITEDVDHSGTATNELISFSDFKGLLQSNPSFARQWAPILRDIRSIMPRGKAGKAQTTTACSKAVRVPMLQTALLDLLDFMDPKPFCRIVSLNHRKSIMPRVRCATRDCHP